MFNTSLVIAPLTWVRLVTSSALQSRKWQLIGMSQGCRSVLCSHLLPALTDNWTHDAANRHTIAPISNTRPSLRSRCNYSFPVPLRVAGWVGLSCTMTSAEGVLGTQEVCKRLASTSFRRQLLSICLCNVAKLSFEYLYSIRGSSITSSSAVAKRPRDSLCLSVVGFNSTISRAQFLSMLYMDKI